MRYNFSYPVPLFLNFNIYFLQLMMSLGFLLMQLVSAPSATVAAPASRNKVPQAEATAGNDDGGIDSDLQARLDNLRKM